MISLVLSMSLLAAGPRAPAGAEVVGYVPRLDATQKLLPFFRAAGGRSVLLRPSSWTEDAHALIAVDVSDAKALADVGIDATGPLTSSRLQGAAVSCVQVSNVDAYRKACDARLARLGEVFEKTEGGVPVYATRDPLGRVQAAYLLRGKDSCAIAGHGRSIEKLIPELVKTISRPANAPGHALAAKVGGVVQVMGESGPGAGALGLTAKDLALTLDARGRNDRLAELTGAGPSPFAAFTQPGMLVVRARLAKAQLPALVEQVLPLFPSSPKLSALAKSLSPLLTGNVALVVSHVQVTSGLRTRDARFFALHFALLAEASDAAALQDALAEPWQLKVREGTLEVSPQSGWVVVSDDAQVKAKALTSAANAAGRQAHGLEWSLDGAKVAAGLAQVPLLEAVQSPELAGVVAASTELGPLLQATTSLSGWLDSSGARQHQGQATWVLSTPPAAPDAGR